jgi:hypothetical protein
MIIETQEAFCLWLRPLTYTTYAFRFKTGSTYPIKIQIEKKGDRVIITEEE